MTNDYEISQDGTIFHIKEDGTISKLGKIENGKIVSPGSDTNSSSTDNEFSWKGVLIFFVVALAITAIVLGVLLSQAKDDYYSALYNNRQTVSELNDRISSLTQERDHAVKEFGDFKDNLGKTIPFVINDIQIGNMNDSGGMDIKYGDSIYSDRTMYLTPRIAYTGIIAGNRKLYVKLFYPDGSLSTGKSSPSGYSFDDTAYIGTGRGSASLMGWGSATKGHYKAGNYRLEIWYNGECLKSKAFTIL